MQRLAETGPSENSLSRKQKRCTNESQNSGFAMPSFCSCPSCLDREYALLCRPERTIEIFRPRFSTFVSVSCAIETTFCAGGMTVGAISATVSSLSIGCAMRQMPAIRRCETRRWMPTFSCYETTTSGCAIATT